MDTNCSYSHSSGIDRETEDRHELEACTFADGTKVQNHSDLWQCMLEANCTVTDDRLQMAVFRDPRPVAVSAYFHLKIHREKNLGSMEDFAIKELPLMCQWVAIRYLIFSGLLSHQSKVFWYDDALADPVAWHYRWLDFVGLQLPAHVVNATADAAVANDFSFQYKHIDKHRGQVNVSSTEVRQFEDEVSPETRDVADAIVRHWLPPVLLAKLGA